MGKKNKYTPAQQFGMLKSTYGGSGHILRNGFEWTHSFQPTPISSTYRIKIEYTQGYYPKIFVMSPKPLPLADGAKRLPHTYDTKRQRLCLFKPDLYEWTSSISMAKTIVHWAVLWMFYYESWLYTGKWLGGGHGNWDVEPKDREEELE